MTQRFEHLFVSVSYFSIQDELEAYAKRGWELVAAGIDPVNANGQLFFKRPFSAESPSD